MKGEPFDKQDNGQGVGYHPTYHVREHPKPVPVFSQYNRIADIAAGGEAHHKQSDDKPYHLVDVSTNILEGKYQDNLEGYGGKTCCRNGEKAVKPLLLRNIAK